MRRRLKFLADQVGWLLGDVACLAMMTLFLPLVPVFKAFERGKRSAKGE
jgi:hypothetical protein